MKQSLALRAAQSLALTPQLQQSIRLLQLSTLELQQEVDQMLLDNPFLENETEDDGPAVVTLDAPRDASADESVFDSAGADITRDTGTDGADEPASMSDMPDDWSGDGSVELASDDSEWGGDAPARHSGAEDDDAPDATERMRGQESLQDFLHRQALALRLGAEDRAALYFLIESLNDDGYLEDSLTSLARGLLGQPAVDAEDDEGDDAGADESDVAVLVQRLRVARNLLQSLEPTGVGARDLAECLSLQLRDGAQSTTAEGAPAEAAAQVRALALRMVAQPLELLARRDVRKLAQLTGGTEAQARAALALIARLEPKPGRRFADVERQIVVPDVIVRRSDSGRGGSQARLRVQLNPDVMPRLRVHEVYAQAFKGQRGSGEAGAHAGLQQRLQEARWFIKNIQQRFDTILRVSQAIVERQKSFFLHGELAMRPLVLREIADELGLHESTISRVTTAKYMATPFGTFELKYFFGSGLGTESGGNASSTAVRALIKQMIAAENPKKPLSDGQLSDLLKAQGIDCARRTVAKYREALRIAPTSLRKSL